MHSNIFAGDLDRELAMARRKRVPSSRPYIAGATRLKQQQQHCRRDGDLPDPVELAKLERKECTRSGSVHPLTKHHRHLLGYHLGVGRDPLVWVWNPFAGGGCLSNMVVGLQYWVGFELKIREGYLYVRLRGLGFAS